MARRGPIKQAEIVQYFAERLRSIRSARGMTQREMSRKSGVGLTYISKLEAGGAAPGLDLMERLASALDVGVVDFLPPHATSDANSQAIQDLLESLLKKSGKDSTAMLRALLERLIESPLTIR